MKSLIPGFWYLEKKNNKEDLKKKEILPTKIYSYKNNIDNWISVDKLYKRILIELTNNLNRIHKLKWKTSSWEVIIGPWLKKYLVVISNRVLLVKTNYNSKKKFLFNHSNNMNLNCYDINDFIYKAINNSWNEEIFKRLEKFFYLKRKNISQIDNIEDVKTNPKKKKIRLKSYIIYFILKIYNSIFTRKSDFVISKPYFGKKILFFKFLLSLKEIPIIYNMDNEKMNLKFNKILRKNFKFQKSLNLNEKISKLLMPECLPKIYLEGFDKVKKKIEISNLPSQKKVIFTSNLRSDSIFKFWLAYQKELGAKIILAQHGGGYNMFKFDDSLSYELNVCDRFLSWGWNRKGNKKVIPFSILNQNIKPAQNFSKKKRGIAIGMNNFDQYVYQNYPPTILNLIDSDKNLEYRELHTLKVFLNGLNDKVKKEIIIRPHPSELRKHTTRNFEKEYDDKFKFERNYKIPGEKFLERFKLNVFMQVQSTTTVFSMTKNFPTLIISPYDLKYFNSETQKIILYLKKVNIFHSCPKKAYKFLNKIHKTPNIWWNKKTTQNARDMFCEYHGRSSNVQNLSKLTRIMLKERNNLKGLN